MAWGINAVYSAREKENDNPVETIVLDTGELDTDELMLNWLHKYGPSLYKGNLNIIGLNYLKHTPLSIWHYGALWRSCGNYFSWRKAPTSLFFDTQNVTGIPPEEWGLESRELLSTSLSIYPSRPLDTDKSKIVRTGYPSHLPLHYVICIPFYVQSTEPNLHFDRLIIPKSSSTTSSSSSSSTTRK